MKEYTIVDIEKFKNEKNWEMLNEASLWRIYQHVQKSNETSYGIISAWRSNFTRNENKARQKLLKSKIRGSGYGFIRLIGQWPECQDVNVAYEDCPEEDIVQAKEVSAFVIGVSLPEIKKWMKELNRDAVIYSGPETKGKAVGYERSGSTFNLGKFKPGKISKFMSKVHGRPFIYEYVAQGFSEALLMDLIKE